MPGTLIRAIAIIAPGMFLSQPPTQRTPSISCPFTAVSIASAITSRETSEYFMPSVPMPMPSVAVGKPNTCGIAPATFTAAAARSTSGWMPALQGFMVEWPLATPTIAFWKSPSPKPTARSIARFGDRTAPWVMVLLLQLSAMGKTPNAENQLRFDCILLERAPRPSMLVHPNFDPIAISLRPIAIRWVARKHGLRWIEVTDFFAPLAPLAFAAVRLGNFINGELYGRVTDVPWGMLFRGAGPLPRHPSQLYQFGLEGVLLFVILWVYSSKARPTAAVSGAFLLGYGGLRFAVEYLDRKSTRLNSSHITISYAVFCLKKKK